MRILLDENFPADFASLLTELDVIHVHGLGWEGIKNGELLRRAAEICDVFVTLDRNLRSNRMADLKPIIPALLAAARRTLPGQVESVGD